jgi:hypothetical protein
MQDKQKQGMGATNCTTYRYQSTGCEPSSGLPAPAAKIIVSLTTNLLIPIFSALLINNLLPQQSQPHVMHRVQEATL